MPDAVMTFRMNAGIPGELSRFSTYGATVTPETVATATATTGSLLTNSTTPGPSWFYGCAVIVDSTGVRPIVGGDTTFSILTWGFLIRPFPTGDVGVAFPSGVVGFGAGLPPLSGVVNVLRRGYFTTRLFNSSAAAKGAQVYVYYGSNTTNRQQGGVEAGSSGNASITGAYFQGPADANGNVEISFNA